jgi:uncharacterized membrane protein
MLNTFLVILVSLIVLDYIFLKLLIGNFFSQKLGPLLKDKFLFPPMVILYLILAASFTFFISYTDFNPVAVGAILGFSIYSIYDLTNLSTLKGWPVVVTIIDLLWGTTLGALVALIATSII